jgi:hypothetical protein
MRNACSQAKAQAKEMKEKRIRDIEAKKLEEANAMRNITGEGEDDQNTNAKKARIDEV